MVPNRAFQASALTPHQMIPHPGSPVLQDTRVCRQGRAQVHFQGLRHIPYPPRGSQVSGLGKLWHVLTGKPWLSFPPCPGSSWRFSSLDLHPSSTGPILLPTPAPAGTNLHKTSTFRGTLKTKQNNFKNPYRPSGKGRRCAAWGESDCREQLFIFLQQ